MKYFSILTLILIFILGCESKFDKYVSLDKNISIEDNVIQSDTLVKRYKEYWYNFRIGNYDESFEYELPYLNYLKPLEWYKNFHLANNKNYKIILLNIKTKKNDKNIVYIRTRFITPFKTYELSDKWVYVTDSWYHYYSQSLLPPIPKPVY